MIGMLLPREMTGMGMPGAVAWFGASLFLLEPRRDLPGLAGGSAPGSAGSSAQGQTWLGLSQGRQSSAHRGQEFRVCLPKCPLVFRGIS